MRLCVGAWKSKHPLAGAHAHPSIPDWQHQDQNGASLGTLKAELGNRQAARSGKVSRFPNPSLIHTKSLPHGWKSHDIMSLCSAAKHLPLFKASSGKARALRVILSCGCQLQHNLQTATGLFSTALLGAFQEVAVSWRAARFLYSFATAFPSSAWLIGWSPPSARR